VTLVCRDVGRSAAFYRNVLGMRLVKQTTSADDRDARHLFFGDEEGRPGTLITCLEYPKLEAGRVGAGSTHHFALTVESEEELAAWRDHLVASGVPCSELLDRTWFKSVYVRDPDGHVVELATRGPGFDADPG
jgi:glyoxylase I family protein